jgi:hypothetical protein
MAQTINGQVFSWSSVRTVIFNRSIVGFDEINYSDKKDVSGVYGRGDEPYDSVTAKYEAMGDISLHMGEVVGIQRAIPAGVRIQDIDPFDIVVTYNENGFLIKDILRGCRFKVNGRGSKNGSADVIKQKMDLFVLSIDYDVK